MNKILKLAYFVLIVLLLLCLAPMPYGFYQLVRFVAMALFVVLAYIYWDNDYKPLAVTFGALALLFQPFLKIALGRVMWNIVDVLVALGLVFLFFYERRNGKELK